MLPLLLLLAPAWSHGPDGCPSTHALLLSVQDAALDAPARACAALPSERPGESTVKAWVLWRDDLWAGSLDEAETAGLLAEENHPERVLEAAEALAGTEHAASAELALDRARTILEGQPFSVARQRLALRWAEAASAAGHSSDGLPPPAAPTPASLKQCADLGRLWARAAVGGVYATDRDCVVRLAETVEGDARRSAAYLALAMSWRHRNREEAVLAGRRLAELLPDDAGVATSLAALYGEVGDASAQQHWSERARELSR